MDEQNTNEYWAIIKEIHPVTQEYIWAEYPASSMIVLEDRQKDATRMKSRLGLPKRCKIVKVHKRDDGTLVLSYG